MARSPQILPQEGLDPGPPCWPGESLLLQPLKRNTPPYFSASLAWVKGWGNICLGESTSHAHASAARSRENKHGACVSVAFSQELP